MPSPSQREAIEADAAPLLVLAGPGAGKTFCLIERIRYLIEQLGLDPERLCAFTFTNKAAGEIADRLARSLGSARRDGEDGHDPRLLRRAAARVRRRASASSAASASSTSGSSASSCAASPFRRAGTADCSRASRRIASAARPSSIRATATSSIDMSASSTSATSSTSTCSSSRRPSCSRDPQVVQAHSRALGLRARRRVSGPESRSVRGDSRARRAITGTSSPSATTSSRSTPGRAPIRASF